MMSTPQGFPRLQRPQLSAVHVVRLVVQDEAQAAEAQARALGPVVEAEAQVHLRMKIHQSARLQQVQEELEALQALGQGLSQVRPKSED